MGHNIRLQIREKAEARGKPKPSFVNVTPVNAAS